MGLDCTGDGTSSTDADGTIASYAWNWGDGAPTTGADVRTHTYSAAGTYTVTLTVTDDDGDTSAVTQDVTVAPPVASPIAFRGTAGVNANSNRPTLTVPGTVQAGRRAGPAGEHEDRHHAHPAGRLDRGPAELGHRGADLGLAEGRHRAPTPARRCRSRSAS